MYEFAVVTLLGLVALKVTDLVIENVPGLDRIRTLFTFTLAVLFAIALDYSVFEGFGVQVREAWMGTIGTGLVIGSLAGAWAALLGWFGTTSATDTTRVRNERPRMAA
jgi:heme O synthase-like polyprenyltransferase